MTSPEEHRRQKIAEELLRRGFLQATLPAERDTLVDFRGLFERVKGLARTYREAEPFPHVVLDDFLPTESFRAVYDALPALEDPKIRWGNLDSTLPDGRPAQRLKYHLQNGLFMAPVLRQFLAELNSGAFLLILQQLTGIEPLVSDPHLQGGGVHYTRRGGSLRVHADFNRHPTYRFDRRLNLLLYMNPEWHEEWGGHLEIWSRDMSHCAERVLPVANRCVIFSTGSDSWHGHPHPLNCPDDQLRRSIALYYYTPAPRADGDDGTHTTHWRDLPGEGAGG